jgi:hypothetical protein
MNAKAFRSLHGASGETTIPVGLRSGNQQESLRQPPELDRDEIVRRLAVMRDFGLWDTGTWFADIERMSPAKVGVSVLAALDWMQDNHEYGPATEQLQILAVNLKNLA